MKVILASLIYVLSAAPAAQAAEVLTWEDCLREASHNNPALIAAQDTVRKARAQYRGSYSEFLPQISADAGYSRTKAAGANATGGSGPQEEFSTGLSARQSLFAGLKHKAGVENSGAELEATEADLQAVRADVGAGLKSAFARLLYAQEQLALAETIAERRKENVRLVELRYNAGREHKGSYLRSRAAFTQARFEVSQARRAARVAQRELAKALGRSAFDVLRATGTLKTDLPAKPPDFPALASKAPSALQAEARERSAAAGVTIAKGQLFPELSATGSVSRAGGDWPPDRDRWSAGVNLSFPFFPGGRNYFDVQSARAESSRAAAAVRNARDQALLGLEEGFASYQDAAERTLVQQEFLEAAQTRSEISRSQYTSGLLSFEDWDLIENDLIATQKTHLASLRDVVLAESQWERAQGKGWIP